MRNQVNIAYFFLGEQYLRFVEGLSVQLPAIFRRLAWTTTTPMSWRASGSRRLAIRRDVSLVSLGKPKAQAAYLCCAIRVACPGLSLSRCHQTDPWVKGAARKPCPSSLDQDTHCSIVRRMTHILVGLAHVMTAPGHGSGTLGFRATCHEWPTE